MSAFAISALAYLLAGFCLSLVAEDDSFTGWLFAMLIGPAYCILVILPMALWVGGRNLYRRLSQ